MMIVWLTAILRWCRRVL